MSQLPSPVFLAHSRELLELAPDRIPQVPALFIFLKEAENAMLRVGWLAPFLVLFVILLPLGRGFIQPKVSPVCAGTPFGSDFPVSPADVKREGSLSLFEGKGRR